MMNHNEDSSPMWFVIEFHPEFSNTASAREKLGDYLDDLQPQIDGGDAEIISITPLIDSSETGDGAVTYVLIYKRNVY